MPPYNANKWFGRDGPGCGLPFPYERGGIAPASCWCICCRCGHSDTKRCPDVHPAIPHKPSLRTKRNIHNFQKHYSQAWIARIGIMNTPQSFRQPTRENIHNLSETPQPSVFLRQSWDCKYFPLIIRSTATRTCLTAGHHPPAAHNLWQLSRGCPSGSHTAGNGATTRCTPHSSLVFLYPQARSVRIS